MSKLQENINIKILLEKNRQELLRKQKKESPKRVQRAGAYSVSQINIDQQALVNDWLVITTSISGNGHTYTDSIAFKNIMTDLIELAKTDSKHYVNGKLILRSIKMSLDKNDIYIACDCPDFKFRYDYFATQDKFKWGKLQNSNGKGIRNPNNDIGSMCKHLYALLRSNNFLDKVSDKIMRTIMANLDIIFKKFKIDLNEFIVNSDRYDRMLKNNSRDTGGRFTSKQDKNDEIVIDEKEDSNEDVKTENIEFNNFTNIYSNYYLNEQILLLFKEILNNNKKYYLFLLSIENNTNKSNESFLINNISQNKLLEIIKNYNINIYNILINKMSNNIFKGEEINE